MRPIGRAYTDRYAACIVAGFGQADAREQATLEAERVSMLADDARHGAAHVGRCAWCRTWVSEADHLRAEAGAMITHGICPACQRELERGTA